LPPTLEDRSIKVTLRRKLKTTKTERLPKGDVYANLRARCAKWAKDNFETLRTATPATPDGLHDRAADNWSSLFAIADLCGEEWGKKARGASLSLTQTTDDETVEVMLLADIERLFKNEGGLVELTDKSALASAAIVNGLNQMEGRPWSEFGQGGKPLTTHKLAKLLAGFKIYPSHLSSKQNGYRWSQFVDALKRYVSP
jgi:hypothetical protein